jgi:hypothetical protein
MAYHELGIDSLARRDFDRCAILIRNPPEPHHTVYHVLLDFVKNHLSPEDLSAITLPQPTLSNSENDAAEESAATFNPDPVTLEQTEISNSHLPNNATSRTIIPLQNNCFQPWRFFCASVPSMIAMNVTPALTNGSANPTCGIQDAYRPTPIEPKMYFFVLAAATSLLTSLCVLFYFIYYRNQATNNNSNHQVEIDRNTEGEEKHTPYALIR